MKTQPRRMEHEQLRRLLAQTTAQAIARPLARRTLAEHEDWKAFNRRMAQQKASAT